MTREGSGGGGYGGDGDEGRPRFGEEGACLGVISFYVSRHPTDACGTNGLPLTPNTVRVCGRAQSVLQLSHPNITEYVAAEVGAGERLFLVSEHYTQHVGHLINAERPRSNPEQVKGILHGVLNGLAYLHARGIVSRNIKPENIRLTSVLQPKLAQYALFHMTECGAAVDFPIGSPLYLSPSVVHRGPHRRSVGNPKDDIWALGLVALELITGMRAWEDCQHTVARSRSATTKRTESGRTANGSSGGSDGPEKAAGDEQQQQQQQQQHAMQRVRVDVPAVCRRLYKLATHPSACGYKDGQVSREDMLSYLRYFQPHISHDALSSVSDDIISFIYACLSPRASTRPSADALLRLPVFGTASTVWRPCLHRRLRCAQLDECLQAYRDAARRLEGRAAGSESDLVAAMERDFDARAANPLHGMPFKDVYYLWTLTGASLERLLSTHGGEQARPSIHRLPRLVRLGLPEIGAKKDPSFDFDDTVRVIDVSKMVSRLVEENADPFPRILSLNDHAPHHGFRSELAKQPLAVRERNLLYQYDRVVLFTRLLRGHPYTRDGITEEAEVDIPPHVRARVWAALLGVGPRRVHEYRCIDTNIPSETDHQLDVDIPRCHQYDLLLSSPTGHAALKRVLKAWIAAHPHLVYWQGLDSLSAPFVRLNLTDEAVAYGCLAQFVELYMPRLFEKNNTEVLNEVMAVFWQLLAYCDPELWWHLEDMCFKPDLFAIPWFLTCYAHVFSLDKIFILWDTLLLSPSSMILCIGVAIMRQLRSQLLSFDFSECILHFGDSPDVDIDTTVRTAKEILESTPSSLLARSTVHPNHRNWDEHHNVPPVDALRSNSSPTLSVVQFEELLLGNDGKALPRSSARVVCIDVRPRSSFGLGHCPGLCINFPIELAVEGEALRGPFAAAIRRQTRGRPVVVIGTAARGDAAKMARALVARGTPRVCVLADGAAGLRQRGLLTSHDPDPVLAKVLERIERMEAAAQKKRAS